MKSRPWPIEETKCVMTAASRKFRGETMQLFGQLHIKAKAAFDSDFISTLGANTKGIGHWHSMHQFFS